MANRGGKGGSSDRFPLLGLWNYCSLKIRRRLLLGKKPITNLDSVFIKQRHHFADKGLYSQGYGLSSNYVQLWELDHKEGRALKNWCFWTVVLEKTPESPLDGKEIKPVYLTGNQPCTRTGLMLKFQYLGHLWVADSWENTDAGKE